MKKKFESKAQARAKVTATIRISPDAWDWLSQKAEKEDTSINNILIALVDKARGISKISN